MATSRWKHRPEGSTWGDFGPDDQLGRLADIHVFYDNTVYAVHSLRDGSRGLWWNPYQNCGQPFLGRIAVAQLEV